MCASDEQQKRPDKVECRRLSRQGVPDNQPPIMLVCEKVTLEKVGARRLNSLATFLSSALLLLGMVASSCLHAVYIINAKFF